ncbi:SurA N-terminal domain-containing protein [Candidatus Daviesbacteria bacterium]|nr:SurA N-terminal domain-containing protein [Candidatus Daviesbacteria bacterium]
MAKKIPLKKIESARPFNRVNNVLDKLSSLKRFRSSKKFYIILAIAGLLLLVIYKKEWFIAATVNGSPITNLELQMKLNKQFRSQTLNQLINEKIILSEAIKNNAVASETEVNKKITEIETGVGGAESLDALLAQQGQTRDSIRQQIRLQLSIEKLYANEATVSAEEVNKFIEQNKDQLRASDSAGQEKEATETIKSQKLSQIFSQKFQELKTKAKIQIF